MIVSSLTVILAALGAARINVLWWGKVSTFALMTTFPLFLLTSNPHHAPLQTWQHDGRDACWVIGIMGLTLSWLVLSATSSPRCERCETGAKPDESCKLARMQIPSELRYSSDHEWAKSEGDHVRVGITDYAQDALGDVVFVDLPKVGATVSRGWRARRSGVDQIGVGDLRTGRRHGQRGERFTLEFARKREQ